MRIHLQLNRTFSYFPTRPLTLVEQDTWDGFPVVYLTPESDCLDPQATHYHDAESSMLDNSCELVDCYWTNLTIFHTADISGMQAETYTWDLFDEKVDAIALDNEDWYLVVALLNEDDEIKLTQDVIRAELATLNIAHEPALFWLQFQIRPLFLISTCLWGAQQLMIQNVKCFKVSVLLMI